MKYNSFGIKIKEYCRNHETKMNTAMSENRVNEELLTVHLEMLCRIQHERLIHLIVTFMCVICELFVVDLVVLHPELGVLPAIIMLALAILLAFYFYHYFFLENTVQRWYITADRLREKLMEKTENAYDNTHAKNR